MHTYSEIYIVMKDLFHKNLNVCIEHQLLHYNSSLGLKASLIVSSNIHSIINNIYTVPIQPDSHTE